MEKEKKEFDFFEYHNQISQENILLSYKGPLSDKLLSEFIRDVRGKFQSDKKVGKKVFAVFMEVAQNVLYYSKEENIFENKRDKVGTIVILRDDDTYRIITGNLIYKKDKDAINEKCKIVNSLDRSELREYKRKLRNQPSEGESKGAGIGLVQAALTSNNPLQVKIKELEGEYAFFILMVNIERSKEEA